MEKKTKTILVAIIGAAIIVVGASLFIILQRDAFPLEGWTYDAELTEQWIVDKYGNNALPPGGSRRVYVKDQTTYPKPIRLYGENLDLAGWSWELIDEGIVDINGTMYWD